MNGPYDEKDAAEDTDSDVKEVRAAWHVARDDAESDDTGGKDQGSRHSQQSGWDD